MTNNVGAVDRRRWGTDRWEQHLGEQVRRSRQGRELSQADLARLANVNRNSVSSLERGDGSSLATLIRVVRALGLTEWLDELAPDPGPSPLALLRMQQERDGGAKRIRSRLAAEPEGA